MLTTKFQLIRIFHHDGGNVQSFDTFEEAEAEPKYTDDWYIIEGTILKES